MQHDGVQQRLQGVVRVQHRLGDLRRGVVQRGERARRVHRGCWSCSRRRRSAVAGLADPQDDVDRPAEVAAQHLVAERRGLEPVGVGPHRVVGGQVPAQRVGELREREPGVRRRATAVAAGHRELEVELAQPVAHRRTRRGSGRRRAGRAACAASAAARRPGPRSRRHRPPAPLLARPGRAARRAGRRRLRVGVLEDRVHQRAEGGARRRGRPSGRPGRGIGARRARRARRAARGPRARPRRRCPACSGSLCAVGRPAPRPGSARCTTSAATRCRARGRSSRAASAPAVGGERDRRRVDRAVGLDDGTRPRPPSGAGPRRPRRRSSPTGARSGTSACPGSRPNISRVSAPFGRVVGRRPPHRDLGPGAGHRDVREPEVLLGLLALRRCGLRARGVRDVEAAQSSSW